MTKDEHRAYMREYMRAYSKTPEGRAKKAAYNQRLDVQAKRAAYGRQYYRNRLSRNKLLAALDALPTETHFDLPLVSLAAVRALIEGA